MSTYPYNALAPMERDEFQPKIPSLLATTQSPTKYAPPYSNIKAPLSKVDYVMMKSSPSTHVCTNCELVSNESSDYYDRARFISNGTTNCTIHCLRNPALWLPKFVKETVQKVNVIPGTDGIYIEDATTLGGIPFDGKVVERIRNMIEKSFKTMIEDAGVVNKDPVLLGIIYQLKQVKNIQEVVIPKYGTDYKGQRIRVGKLFWNYGQPDNPNGGMVMFIVNDVAYHLNRLDDGRIAVRATFSFFGLAMKKPITFDAITLFYV